MIGGNLVLWYFRVVLIEIYTPSLKSIIPCSEFLDIFRMRCSGDRFRRVNVGGSVVAHVLSSSSSAQVLVDPDILSSRLSSNKINPRFIFKIRLPPPPTWPFLRAHAQLRVVFYTTRAGRCLGLRSLDYTFQISIAPLSL